MTDRDPILDPRIGDLWCMRSDPPESAWEIYDYSDTVLIWKMENGRLLTVQRKELHQLEREGWYFLKHAEDRTDETTL